MKSYPGSQLLSLMVLAFAGTLHQSNAADLRTTLDLSSTVPLPNGSILFRIRTNSVAPLSDAGSLAHVTGGASARFGYLHINFSDSFLENETSSFNGGAAATAAWNDWITISNPALNGKPGLLRVKFLISGTVAIQVGAATEFSSAGVTYGLGFFDLNPHYELNATRNSSPKNLAVNIAAPEFAGNSNLDVHFTFGTIFPFNASLSAYDRVVFQGSESGVHNVSLQMQWRGATVLDANTNEVAFTLVSESGTDWIAPRGVVAGTLQISGSKQVNGTDYVISGVGGGSFNTVTLLSSTNLALPASNWLPTATGIFDTTGHVSFTNQFSPGEKQVYFLLQAQ